MFGQENVVFNFAQFQLLSSENSDTYTTIYLNRLLFTFLNHCIIYNNKFIKVWVSTYIMCIVSTLSKEFLLNPLAKAYSFKTSCQSCM